MNLRTHTLADGRIATLSRDPHGYTARLTLDGSTVSGKTFAPRSRAKALEHFVELCTASAAAEAFYSEALFALYRASAHLGHARQRSITDGVLGAILRGRVQGAGPAARGLRRLAEETGDTTVAGLATRVESLHVAALVALPTAVRAPLSDAAEARS